MSNQPPKLPNLNESELEPLATGFGFCLATNRVMLEGKKVTFAYREPPDNNIDSGWRFLAGDEDDKYLENDENVAAYDINVVANHSPDIIHLLEEPVGTAYELDEEADEWVEIELIEDDEDEE